jgi:ATP-dependent Zn protease
MLAYFSVFPRAGSDPGADLMSIGQSKGKVYAETETNVSFKDVEGVDEAKQNLQEIVSFLIIVACAPDQPPRISATASASAVRRGV